jgi:pilus assembly protein CpaC
LVWATAVLTLASGFSPQPISAEPTAVNPATLNPSIIQRISGLSEKLELTTNSSRVLTLDMKIPRVQVNNPDLLVVTPLSDHEIQVSAKKAGVTQINVWDENEQIHSIDVLIYGDAQELQHALQVQFPHSSIQVYRYSESLVLKGFVDRPDYVSQIMRLAEDYAPKVINNITVGGVQQVLLKVKVYEVSRTKARRLGVDFAVGTTGGGSINTSVSGLISSVTNDTFHTIADSGGQTVEFSIFDGSDSVFGFLEALQECQVAKILAEPNLVAVSGRPAQFNSGGEIPILVPQSLGTVSIEYKKFGTQVDFLPIVLGNGNIRLEVRPRVSSLDDSIGTPIPGFTQRIPGFRVREVDTAVEMRAGQTFALAGLVEERVETSNAGVPYLSDIPVFGVPFRKTQDEFNEIELLILVTPEFVDAMDPCEVPCGRPGFDTVSPSNSALYCGGHVEVPAYCNPIRGPLACGEPYCGDCGTGGSACHGDPMLGAQAITTDNGVYLPGGTGYDYSETSVEPTPAGVHGELSLPSAEPLPSIQAEPLPDHGAQVPGRAPALASAQPSGSGRPYTSPRPYSPSRAPVYLRNTANPQSPSSAAGGVATGNMPEMIGPVGYDVQ